MAAPENKERDKELVNLFQAVEKAAALGGRSVVEESRCLDALCRLKSFPVTAQPLISTKIGKCVRQLKKNPSKKIQDLASDVNAIWTKQLLQQVASTRLKKTSSDHHVPKCNDVLSKVSSEAKEDVRVEVNACDPVGVAVSLESALFKNWGSFGSNRSNKAKYRSVLFNIKDPKNPDFRRKLLLGQVEPGQVVNMSAKEMASGEKQHENRILEAKSLMKCVTGTVKKGTTDAFECGRCGKRETTYCQLQTRSADEPMTTYVTCVICNNHWKFC
ncbi:unnamed protein product [Dovyalis caffra]|uniref:Transcription elongation factor TFIIS n=1 Tax=Dovyalis caffra TaxID=77055 RepID=A0AAV1SVA6_9ROSI|nr:unnamed protein product [Dovyalis caffra]